MKDRKYDTFFFLQINIMYVYTHLVESCVGPMKPCFVRWVALLSSQLYVALYGHHVYKHQ